MSTDTASRVERVKYRGAETTLILEADNMSIRAAPDGCLVVELFRYGANGEALEGYQMRYSPEDRARLREHA